MDPLCEESCSLKPNICDTQSPYTREYRLKSVRLGTIYYFTWILMINMSIGIPFYQWYFIDGPECWSYRYMVIMSSILVSMLTTAISTLLFLFNCITRVTVSYWRLNFCTLCFIMLTILSIMNFLLAVFTFSLTTCYIAQIMPSERLLPEFNWLQTFTFKYDVKIVGLFHIIICLLSFFTAIGFAIIKNNFKYIRQIDLE